MSCFLSRLSGTTKAAALTSRQVSNVVETHESNGGSVPGFGALGGTTAGGIWRVPALRRGRGPAGEQATREAAFSRGAACDATSVAQGGGDRVVLERPGEPAGRLCPNGQCLPVPQARGLQQVANKYLLVD